MKKRVISILLAAAMAMSVTACGNGEEKKAEDAAKTEGTSGEDGVQATVIWRAFDDQFQSGFRIIMQNEEKKMGGISLDMQDAANDVSTAISKLEAALTKGTDVAAICAPDRESTKTMMEKCDAEGVPAVFFNMEPMEETMQAYENIMWGLRPRNPARCVPRH